MNNKFLKSIVVGVFLLVIFIGSFVFIKIAFAQPDLGMQQVSSTIGLPTTDIRVIVASIIRTALGLLGIVVFCLVLYGGFVWMTAAGNEEKVTQAKKILVNSVIGLIIILSSYTIVSFVISKLVDATTGTGGGGGGGGGDDDPYLSSGSFYVDSLPSGGNLCIRNIHPAITFNRGVDLASMQNNVGVFDASGNAYPGSWQLAGANTATFVPEGDCGDSGPDDCFAASTNYTLRFVNAGLVRSSDGTLALNCLLRAGCGDVLFTSGDGVDREPPQVEIQQIPEDLLSVDSNIPVTVNFSDDNGVQKVILSADGYFVGSQSVSGCQRSGSVTVNWPTSRLAPGSHTITGTGYDWSMLNNASSTSVYLRPLHCFDGLLQIDLGEQEIGPPDCGAECGACGGGACSSGADCASGYCEIPVGSTEGVCVNKMRITGVSPLSGGPSTWVTINGQYFGANPGKVFFSATANKNALPREANTNESGWIEARQPSCSGQNWSSTQILAEVPTGALTGPVKVVRDLSANLWPASGNFEGANSGFGNYAAGTSVFNNNSHSGSRSLEIRSGAVVGGGGNYGGASSGFPVLTPGKLYTFSFWARNLSNAGNVAVSIQNGTGDQNCFTFVVSPSAEWRQYTRTCRLDIQKNRVFFYSSNANSSFLLDDIKVVESGIDYSDHFASPNTPESNWGPAISDFTVNTLVRPGLCSVTPSTGLSAGTDIRLAGKNFGTAGGSVMFGQNNSMVSSWADASINSIVPILNQGVWGVKVVRGAVESNGLRVTTISEDSNGPIILSVSPGSGARGEYITLTGNNFGDYQGRVVFKSATGVELAFDGDFTFPAGCKVSWSNSQIVVKFPKDKGAIGNSYYVQVKAAGSTNDWSAIGPVFELVNGSPAPGICAVDPVSGPIPFGGNKTMKITGEYFSNTGRATIPTDGLLLHYTFDSADVIGSSVLDKSGHNYHGVNSGAVSDTGRVGQAFRFNGTSNKIDISAAALTTPATYGGAKGESTIIAWVRPENVSVYNMISQYLGGFHYLSAGTNDPAMLGRVRTMVRDTQGNVNFWPTSNTRLNNGEWAQIAFVFKGGDGYQFFINGSLVGEGSYTDGSRTLDLFSYTTGDACIGCGITPTEGWFRGLIDDLRVYSRVLSGYEIEQIYHIQSGASSSTVLPDVYFWRNTASTSSVANREPAPTGDGVFALAKTSDGKGDLLTLKPPSSFDTGPVVVYRGSDEKISNAKNFEISDCRNTGSTCSATGGQCCVVGPDAGMCKPSGVLCSGQVLSAGYLWRFSTREIPIVPHVIERCDDSGSIPSPSPSIKWNSITGNQHSSVCRSAGVIVDFSGAPINNIPQTEIVINECSPSTIDQQKKTCTPIVAVPLRTDPIDPQPSSASTDYIELYPALTYNGGKWRDDSWYQVALKNNISIGVGMEEIKISMDNPCDLNRDGNILNDNTAYCFIFKTGSQDCKISKVVVTPYSFWTSVLEAPVKSRSAVSDPGIDLLYKGHGLSDQKCIVMDVSGFDWSWKTNDRTKSEIFSMSGFNNINATVSSLGNTVGVGLPNDAVQIEASAVLDSLNDGLTSWWRFENNGSGQVGNTLSFNRPPVYIAGQSQQAISFDGTASNNATAIEPVSLKSGNSWTISGWIRAKSVSGADKIAIGKVGWHAGIIWAGNDMSFAISSRNVFWGCVSMQYTPQLNRWYHYVATYDSQNRAVNYYVNGILHRSGVACADMNFYDNNLYIGGSSANPTYASNIDVDEVRIYNRAITSVEVSSLYNRDSDLGGSIPALETYRGQSPLTIDLSNPQVVDHWPKCFEACQNALVGVKFNTTMSNRNLNVLLNGPVKLSKCLDENCASIVNVPLSNVALSNATNYTELTITPVTILDPNALYKVTLSASTTNLGSTELLWSAAEYNNPSVSAKPMNNIFTWKFKTKNSPCKINKVSVVPQLYVARNIFDRAIFEAQPYSSPDSCDARGQKIDAWKVSWNWSSSDTEVAEVNTFSTQGSNPFCTVDCLRRGSAVPFGYQGVAVCGNDRLEAGEDCEPPNEKNGCGLNCLNTGVAVNSFDSSLVAYYGFEQCNAQDNSVNNFNGTITGASCVDRDEGKAYAFDGIDDVITIANNPKLEITGDMAISSWIRPSRFNAAGCDSNTVVSGRGWETAAPYIFGAQGGNICLSVATTNGWFNLNANTSIPLNEWTHIAMIRRGQTVVFFKNGVSVGTSTFTGTPVPSGNGKLIGKGYYGAPYFYMGQIDSVRIYDRSLSNTEIQQIYSKDILDGVVCGNGKVEKSANGYGEECDPNDPMSQAGCSSSCLHTGSSATISGTDVTASICGNGLIGQGEDCDAGILANISINTSSLNCTAGCLHSGTAISGNWCYENSTLFGGFATDTYRSACSRSLSVCGDGITDPNEDVGCDTGIGAKADNCTNACLRNDECVVPSEGCENGENIGSSVRYSASSYCGDGIAGTGEDAFCETGLVGDHAGLTDPFALVIGRGASDVVSGNPLSQKTNIIGATSQDTVAGMISGSGEFKIPCGYTKDEDCRAYGADWGLGNDTCCHLKPRLISVYPGSTTTIQPNICVNTAIYASFDKKISFQSISSTSSTESNIILARGIEATENCRANELDVTSLLAYNQAGKPASWYQKIIGSIFGFIRNIFSDNASAASAKWCALVDLSRPRIIPEGTGVRVELNLVKALDYNTEYKIFFNNAVRGSDGVSIGNDINWRFITGGQICEIDKIKMSPSDVFFYRPTMSTTLFARPLNAANAEIQPVQGYEWIYQWNGGSPYVRIQNTTSTSNIITAENRNGETDVYASANITTNTYSSQIGVAATGRSHVIVFLCENPWPPRELMTDTNSDGVMEGPFLITPFDDKEGNNDGFDLITNKFNNTTTPASPQGGYFNFSSYYCADSGVTGVNDDLPYLRPAIQVSSDVVVSDAPTSSLKRFIFTNEKNGDAIGIQVFPNPRHLSVNEWFQGSIDEGGRGFVGTMQNTTVNGYPAITDGNNYYVEALNYSTASSRLYTNIYLISLSADAKNETKNVFEQMLKNFRFNTNLTNYGWCGLNMISPGVTTACETDLDCTASEPVCSVQVDKLKRNYQRLRDLELIQGLLDQP